MRISFLNRLRPLFSLNDPQWGRGSKDSKHESKKPEDGPPELDQLWRDFNQSIAKMFGKSGGGDNGGSSNDSMFAKIGFGVILLVFGFFWLISGFFIVQEGQTGVITTFGKYSYQANPGFNWRWPTPIQAHEIVNVLQVRTVEVGYRNNVKNKQPKEALMLTDDENIIDIQFAVQYKLKDAAKWLYSNRDQEEMIRQVAETAIREIVGRSKMDFVLYEGREKVALDVNVLMQQVLDRYESGAQITNVTMQAVQPPEQVQAAFDDAVKAGQDKERQKNEGQAYANDVIPKARGEASRLLQDAEGYRSKVVANAEGNVARFKQVLVEYQKAPAVTRDRMYLETMQQIFSSTTKLMMDAKNANNMIYLPLDKLNLQGESTSKSNTSSALNTAPTESMPTVEVRGTKDGRARDSRDRESR
ncbi:FtsH protease activity modulator HflK [Undibacterium fentianense]|uniref:Protein HflK n=1 Tax=Undibacterium fentianense TaxID=2828728 RepID=A0A941DXZ2_9BURK|nr:FtsH protease activity modulator HflK [Undibacterium fentianense]MBR7798830.1 FtsH protease activity modulator HflK [Undibacterium fentianense]